MTKKRKKNGGDPRKQNKQVAPTRPKPKREFNDKPLHAPLIRNHP